MASEPRDQLGETMGPQDQGDSGRLRGPGPGQPADHVPDGEPGAAAHALAQTIADPSFAAEPMDPSATVGPGSGSAAVTIDPGSSPRGPGGADDAGFDLFDSREM